MNRQTVSEDDLEGRIWNNAEECVFERFLSWLTITDKTCLLFLEHASNPVGLFQYFSPEIISTNVLSFHKEHTCCKKHINIPMKLRLCIQQAFDNLARSQVGTSEKCYLRAFPMAAAFQVTKVCRSFEEKKNMKGEIKP